MKFLRRLIAAPAILLAPPSVAQTAPAPAPVTAPAATTDADPALWVVKDADTTIYLFGTIHVLKPGLSWFDEGVKKAFDSSDELVLEMVQPDPAAMQSLVMSKAFSTTGPTLPEKLPAADRPVYLKALADLGIPAPMFDRAQPWFAATNLSLLPLMKLGYDPASGPESVLTAAAATEKKPVAGLETPEQQIGFLANLSDGTQLQFLESTLKDLPKTAENMDKMVGAWSRGDPAKLGEIMNEGLTDSPELAKTLLFDRNARWAQWIKARLAKPGTVFIAVGAGHLAGQQSVIEQLKALKLTATRVAY
ncbi:TraB/GumN family protein [Sphingomonas bacterium]|uniref:TraB/GumN family protein n=1 Tax=Sphingomonas bacterium TaxID=1895847 RepID=UPI002639A834|nr:TraB/GumN family protein [Sphingomonas bacterium]MDB5679830.1 TraB/GumN family protein [Sphingomonas bacterium]